ncbi:hypothetical protein [Liquorilactobacillus mali]|uniref:hypothetical protein n=1 Tax=Liquorilactobacillus mali TaxID=1618 RepID=UPI0002491694|nr:hypothetical protein [Liquorilactobacillus mali]QFQ74445.1 hypothetical protein LM596_04635 [Liquorilactobacillus mali]
MFNLNANSKIYIVSPYYKTGGPRSFHQLANKLVELGFKVFIIYGNHSNLIKVDKILYSDCKADIGSSVEDDSSNLIITSEYDTGWLLRYDRIQKCIWWLSLDYYLVNNPLNMAKHKIATKKFSKLLFFAIFLKHLVRLLRRGKYGRYYPVKRLIEVNHMFNCEYVREYLIKKGVSDDKTSYLCGPIDLSKEEYSLSTLKDLKEDIVCYNPAKMNLVYFEKVKKEILKRNNKVRFVAIENLNHNEVWNLLMKSKVYLDFGYFPGPERLPREAVTAYCNLITSNTGSARNSEDVPIKEEYKFELSKYNITKIAAKVEDMLFNYTSEIRNFDMYRVKVYNQVSGFTESVKKIFGDCYGNNKEKI